jgi:hypothetical protein
MPPSYEPDEDDFAYMAAEEKEITSLRSGYHEAHGELRNYQKHTDRELRGLYKEKKSIARHLAREHRFDVVSDCFEVEAYDEGFDTVPWPYDDSYKGPRAPTRKDKRRAKTKQRKAVRRLTFSMNARPAQSSVVRKTGALLPVVAA